MRYLLIGGVVTMAWLGSACSTAPQSSVANQSELGRQVTELEERVQKLEDLLKFRKRNPSTTTIVLSKSGSGCDTAKVMDERVGNLHSRHVRWNIEDECGLSGNWRVELRFAANGGKFPFKTSTLVSKGGGQNRFVQDRILGKDEVDEGIFKYTIWLQQGMENAVELADPELEIEPPPDVRVTGQAVETPPPPKKQ